MNLAQSSVVGPPDELGRVPVSMVMASCMFHHYSHPVAWGCPKCTSESSLAKIDQVIFDKDEHQ